MLVGGFFRVDADVLAQMSNGRHDEQPDTHRDEDGEEEDDEADAPR